MSLQKIQERLHAPKSQFNKFGNYPYRNIEDIQEALKPLLSEYEYSLIISDDIVSISDRVYVKSTASLIDKKNTVIAQNTAFAREPLDRKGMDASQITGATSSYSRKYCLGGMFLLDDTKDADSVDNSGNNKNYTAPQNHPNQPLNTPKKTEQKQEPPKSKKDLPPGERLLNMVTAGYEDVLREAYLAVGEDGMATAEEIQVIKGATKQRQVLEAALRIMKENAGAS